ncbi:MAG: MFS transporter [Actinomycetota bacterium]|nr:MFS transporter [Actinomycetota bacterium]
MRSRVELSETPESDNRTAIPRRAWRALAIGSLGFSLMSFNTTATNMAFSDIADEFTEASSGAMSWVPSVFFIGMASLLLVSGRLADRIGRRLLFRAGLLAFALGSTLSAVAPNVYVLIFARLVTSAGGAMILPSSLAVVLPEFPKDRHFSAVAMWSATGPLASSMAPGISALVLSVADWRMLFALSTPIALVTLVGSFGTLAESKATDRSGSLDVLGVILGTLAIGTLVFGASFGGGEGWTSPLIIGSFLSSAVLFPLVIQRCRTHPTPLLNLKVFTLPPVAVANVANFLLNFAGLATWLVWPLFMTRVWGYSKLEVGLSLLPSPLVSGIVTSLGGRLSERYGHERMVRWGSLISTVAVLLPLFTLSETRNYAYTAGPSLIGFGLGWSLTQFIVQSAVVNRVNPGLYGEVNASFNTIRNIGGALGIAVAVSLLGSAAVPDSIASYKLVFGVFGVCVVACTLVLWLIYPRVSAAHQGA